MLANKENITTTIRLPRSLWGRIKAIATEQDKKVEDVVRELLEEKLKLNSGGERK